MSGDTCQDSVSPQSLQLFPAMSVDGVTQTPKVQLNEQIGSGYRSGHSPCTSALCRDSIGKILIFHETSGRLCCVWLGRGSVRHSTGETSAEGLQLTLLLTLMFFKGVLLLWTAMESCSQHGCGS